MNHITMANGERDRVVRRYKIHGKNRGFLSITESGNCYTTLAGKAWWVCDLSEYPDVDRTDRKAVFVVYEAERKERDTEAFVEFIARRLKK